MSNTEAPIIVGLDIGTTKVAAIAGRRNAIGKLEILGFGRADSSGVEHGMVLNLQQCIKSIRLALEECLESNDRLHIREVYVGIAGQHIKSLQNRGERVRAVPDDLINRFDIEALIRDQRQAPIPAGDRIIDIVPQDFTVDGFSGITNPIGRTGVKIGANFHLITGDAGAIRNIKRSVEESGLRVKDLVLQPLASAAAVMSAEEFEAGVAIVDIGGGTTDLAVFADNMLKHTKVIPFAGVNITQDIRKGLNVLKSQAEQLKVQFGCAIVDETPQNDYITIPGIHGAPPKEISRRNLAHIIQARMEEILDFVVYELRAQNLENKISAGIILTGGGSSLSHLRQLTEYRTGLNARLGHPTEHLAPGFAKELSNPIYATCIGLILRGIQDYETGKIIIEAVEDVHLNHEPILPPAPPAATQVTQTDVFAEQTEVEQSEEEQETVEAQEEVYATSEAAETPTSATSGLSMPNIKLPNVNIGVIKNTIDRRLDTVKNIFGTIGGQLMTWFDEVDDPMLKDDNNSFRNEPEDHK
ncbi:MAG: cell division protein FtsA [Bacteroidota bacterium]|jgi:cell division protein FtsA